MASKLVFVPVSVGPASAPIEGFDLARAIAFIGMVFVNFRIAIAPDEDGSRSLPWHHSEAARDGDCKDNKRALALLFSSNARLRLHGAHQALLASGIGREADRLPRSLAPQGRDH